MPFPGAVREEALVDAARHCCVCHRYKGVKVEVHHIVPESRGGPNSLDNAIALCFDCHADAGHYNPHHPRGTKFSPSELRRHRDEWHAMVRHHAIQSPDALDLLYCRYLLCKSFDAFRETTLGELSHIPASNPLLVTNSVRHFQRKVIERHPERYRHDQVWGDAFASRESYSQAYPEVRVVERSSINLYPYFEAVRAPSREELCEKVAPRDAVTQLLVESGVSPAEIAVALAYDEVCGARCFQEVYRLRPLWALYLAATNVSGEQLVLSLLDGEKETPAGVGYRPFAHRLAREIAEEALPAAPLPPEATVLVPIATLLGPMATVQPVTLGERSEYLPSGQGQVVAHQDLTTGHEATALMGPAFWPRSIALRVSAAPHRQPVHEFDLANLYTIGRFWEAGSCPHLFACKADGRSLRYLGELFARQATRLQTERVVVPADARILLIAELERERTTIEKILINGVERLSTVRLARGDLVRLSVRPGDLVELRGFYTAVRSTEPNPWLRNCVILEFLTSASVLAHPASSTDLPRILRSVNSRGDPEQPRA